MLTYKETQIICGRYFTDCYYFWRSLGHNGEVAFVKARGELLNLEHDPFSPCGHKINNKAKQDFIYAVDMMMKNK